MLFDMKRPRVIGEAVTVRLATTAPVTEIRCGDPMSAGFRPARTTCPLRAVALVLPSPRSKARGSGGQRIGAAKPKDQCVACAGCQLEVVRQAPAVTDDKRTGLAAVTLHHAEV